jgi:hypothetical protein
MKRFAPNGIGILILALVLFLGGLDAAIWPQAGIVPHFTNGAFGSAPRSEMEVVSTTGARVYGVLAMLFGAAIGFMAFYHNKK